MKITEAFRDAEALAGFANLDATDSAAVSYFRNNYPDFAPPEWWDYITETLKFVPTRETDPPIVAAKKDPNTESWVLGAKAWPAESMESIWQGTQEDIQAAWDREFHVDSIFELTELLKMVFIAPTELVVTASHLYLPDGALCELGTTRMYAFHKAVLYLYQQPWRAKICKDCKKYFIANHPKREYCEYPDARGETCRQKNDNRRHLDYYYVAGKKKRQQNSRRRDKAAKNKSAR